MDGVERAMNKQGRNTETTPSAWSLEVKRFKELYEQWLDYHLNKFFDLSINGPRYRSSSVFIFRMIFIAIALVLQILLFSFSNLFLAQQTKSYSSLHSLVIVSILAFVRLLFILSIPIYIATEIAGNYITDIFELKD